MRPAIAYRLTTENAVGAYKASLIGVQGAVLMAMILVSLTALALVTAAYGQPAATVAAAAAETEQEGVETLTQGPIHEAFANPSELDPTPGPVVSKQPPGEITEEPPAYMPEGSIWIPGYWIWDDEREDFVWVTGAARVPPPGMRFVPGYWAVAEGGWQRVSGFWVSADAADLEYRQPPPESHEAGPSSPAPSETHFWVPGTWLHYDTGDAWRWRAGYWSPYQPDWIWSPARWVWTPAGCVYIPGYWDYRMSFRGNIFAPVYFPTTVYTRPGWFYRPWCVIPTNNLFIHLWIRPRNCHYYFGNYYGPRYVDWGFQPWCYFPARRHYYDPFFAHARVHYRRQGIDFIGRTQNWHDHFHDHADRRPPRTWRETQELLARRDRDRDRDPVLQTQLVARNIVEIASRDDAPIRLTRVDDQKREALRERAEKLRALNDDRKKIEREGSEVARRTPRADDVARDSDRDGARDKAKGRGPDDRDRPGSLIERAEGTARDAAGRGRPKLRLPEDPTAQARTAARPRTDEGREAAGQPDVVPPPMPETERGKTASDDRRGPRTDRGEGKGESRADRGPRIERPDEPKVERRADQPPAKGEPRTTDEPRVPRDEKAGREQRDEKAGREARDEKAGTEDRKVRSKERPDRGPETPKAKRPETKALPDASTPRDTRSELPEGRVDRPRVDPRSELPEGRVETPRVDPRSELPGRTPGSNFRGEPGRRPESLRNQPSRETPRSDAPSGDRPAPKLREPSPAPMPRVEPRDEARPMPRVETPRENRPMPRVEVPRETRPAPRVEVPKESPRPAPRVETPRAAPERAPRVEPSRAPERAPRSESPRSGDRAPRGESPRRDNDREARLDRPRGSESRASKGDQSSKESNDKEKGKSSSRNDD